MNTFFLDRLNSEPHALAFAGQSTPWPVTLADQSANPVLDEALHTHADAAQALLYPVSADLLATTGRPVDLFGFEPNPARLALPQRLPPAFRALRSPSWVRYSTLLPSATIPPLPSRLPCLVTPKACSPCTWCRRSSKRVPSTPLPRKSMKFLRLQR